MSFLQKLSVYLQIVALYKQKLNRLSKYIVPAIFVFVAAILRQIFWKIYFKIRGFPNGPIGLPLFGSAIDFALNPFRFLSRLPVKYGPVAYVPLMTSNNYLISDPQILRQLYQHQKIYDRPPFKLRDVLGFVDQNATEIWEKRRKYALQTVLTLTNSSFVLEKVSESLEKYIQPIINEQYVKKQQLWFPQEHIKYIIFQNIWCCVFDNTLSFDDPFIAKYIKATGDWAKTVGVAILCDILLNVFGINEFLKDLLCYPSSRKQNEILLTWMNNNGFEINVSQNILKRIDDIHGQKSKNRVYIDLLIEKFQQNQISVASIIADVQGLLTAALDTTGKTLEYGFILLAKYPTVQEMIYKELQSVMDEHKLKQFNFSIMNELHTMKAFIYETMRITTTTPMGGIPHMITNSSCKLKINGKKLTIPQYSILHSNVYYMNRFMDWNNGKPLQYDNKCLHLEYWLDSENKFKKNDNFVGFGVGKRNCPGQALAIRQMYAIFGLMVGKYKFIAPNNDPTSVDIQQRFDIVPEIHPKIGIHIEPRL